MTEIIPKQKHTRDTAIYSISKAFERASFYGVRTLLFLYLIETSSNLSQIQSIALIGWFLFAFTISKIIGALLGDLLFKTKKVIVFGGILQTLGCFTICFGSSSIMIGMGLIAVGSGLYTSNVLAQFGRLYINKTKIIDAGFSIYYSAANIGSFLGAFLIAIIGERYGCIYGFLIAGACMLVSTIILLFHQEKQVDLTSNAAQPKIKNRTTILIVCFISVVLFWNFHQLSFFSFQDIQYSISDSYSNSTFRFTWDIISNYAAMFFAVIASIVWTFFYYNQLKKIVLGFLSLSIGFFIVIFIDTSGSGNSMFLAVIATLIIAFAEVHINPILNSIVTRSIKPKFLAIAFSISYIPGLIIGYSLSNLKYDYIYKMNNTEILIIGVSGLGVIGLTLLILVKSGLLKTTYNTK